MKLERLKTKEKFDITKLECSHCNEDLMLREFVIEWDKGAYTPAMQVGDSFVIHMNLDVVNFKVSAILEFAPSFAKINVSNMDVVAK